MTVELIKYKNVNFALVVRTNCKGVVAGHFESVMATFRFLRTLPCRVASGDQSFSMLYGSRVN